MKCSRRHGRLPPPEELLLGGLRVRGSQPLLLGVSGVGEAPTLRDVCELRSRERAVLSFEREPRSHISGEERGGFSATRSAAGVMIGRPPIDCWSPYLARMIWAASAFSLESELPPWICGGFGEVRGVGNHVGAMHGG